MQEAKAHACKICENQNFGAEAIVHNLAVDKFLSQDVEVIVNQLPCRCQEVYRLSRNEQLTTNEIASKLGISQKTVKNHLTKALSRIDRYLQANA